MAENISLVNVKDKVLPSDLLTGRVTIYKVASGITNEEIQKLIAEKNYPCEKISNLITDEVAEFFTGYLGGDSNYQFTHVYGQWGEVATYPEGGGPFFTPVRSNQVTDLTYAGVFTMDAQVPIIHKFRSTQAGQSEFANNRVSVIGIITGNNNKSYIGAGLVCRLPSGQELLLAHVALDGILKDSSFNIMIVWDWLFTNT